MNKKIILILAGIGIFFFIMVIILLTSPGNPVVNPLLPPSPTSIPTQTNTSADKIKISGIKTNNFLINPIKTNSRGDVVFIKISDYQITYLKEFNEFIINLSTPSAAIRENAELTFLAKLGISKEDACKLKVSVSAPYTSGQNLTAPKRILSFCPAKQQEY